jgi:hypothetical protein
MNRILKVGIMAAALGATTLATLPAANAGDWRWRHHRSSHNGDAVIAGVAGLAAGALIAGALSQPRSAPSYYEPDYYDYDQPRYVVRRQVVVRPAPVREYGRVAYSGSIEPWTRGWYAYCSDRYRTFNARTGTFTGYDGQQHFCVAN